MGLYALNKDTTSAFTIGVGSTEANATSDAWTKLGESAGSAILVNSDDDVYEKSNSPAIVNVTLCLRLRLHWDELESFGCRNKHQLGLGQRSN